MKFLDRIHTRAFRRQAMIFGGGLIVGWFKYGWSPWGMLGTVVLWYLLVFMISVVVGGCYLLRLALIERPARNRTPFQAHNH
jgi:hypothetical protein